MSRYSCCNRRKGGGKTVIAMYTCKDNLTPLLYSGKIKKKFLNKKNKKIKKKKYLTSEKNVDEKPQCCNIPLI